MACVTQALALLFHTIGSALEFSEGWSKRDFSFISPAALPPNRVSLFFIALEPGIIFSFFLTDVTLVWHPLSGQSHLIHIKSWLGKHIPSSVISQSVSWRSLAATKSALTALPFTFTLWRLALALNRWSQPWLALKDALMLHRVSSPSLIEGF